jgi:hypothetical protein
MVLLSLACLRLHSHRCYSQSGPAPAPGPAPAVAPTATVIVFGGGGTATIAAAAPAVAAPGAVAAAARRHQFLPPAICRSSMSACRLLGLGFAHIAQPRLCLHHPIIIRPLCPPAGSCSRASSILPTPGLYLYLIDC